MKIKLLAILTILAILASAFPASAIDSTDNDSFKVLFIGNSFSDDATDGAYYSDSMLFNIMKSMVGDREVAVGLIWSGGKTMAWHASMAKKDTNAYSFFYTDSYDGWSYIGAKTSAEALAYTDWDAIVIQPYGQELKLGYSSPIEGTLDEFMKFETSVPYMLDHVAKHAPPADIYLYLIWSTTTEKSLNAGIDDFRTIAEHTRLAETYTGTESGKGFTGVIPVGSAVQAARNTYLAKLDYNANAIEQSNITTGTDPQIGLQRDSVHLSLNLGRYLANLTVAETLIPESMRIKDRSLPKMRVSESAGKLPDEYTEIVRLATDAAIESTQYNGNAKYIPRMNLMSAYTNAPIDTVSEAVSGKALVIGGAENTEELEDAISEAVIDISNADINVTAKAKGSYTPPASGESTSVIARITVTHGYQSKDLDINVTAKPGYVITSSADKGGTVSKLGEVKAPEGEDYTFTVIPDEGYEVSDVIVDGVSVGAVDSYTFKAVSAKHTIEAKFEIKNPFTDVVKGKWYYEGAVTAALRGYMNGTNKERTLFSPNMEFTREQFVQLLFNMEGLRSADYAGATGFTDVPEGKWYSAAVKWAKDTGVTNGVGDGQFGLGGKVSREQLSKFLMNYAKMQGSDTSASADITSYTDAGKVSSWAKDAVSWAVAENLIGSTDKTKLILSPKKIATRAEIAKITISYDEYLGK